MITDREGRNEVSIQREAALDGIYVLRAPVSARELTSENVIQAYKQLSAAEQAFGTLKSVDLRVRPIRHRFNP